MSLLTYHAVHGEGPDEGTLFAFVKWEIKIWIEEYQVRYSFSNKSSPDGELRPEMGFQVVLISSLFLPADPCCSGAALCNERNLQSGKRGRRQQCCGPRVVRWERGFSVCHLLRRELKRFIVLLFPVSWNGSCGWLSRFEGPSLCKWTLSANKMLPASGSSGNESSGPVSSFIFGDDLGPGVRSLEVTAILS